MKWIENGISFEGTVSEYKELHADAIPAPVRTRKGKSIAIIEADGSETTFLTLKDAAAYITQKTGRYVSASHLGTLNGATVELKSFAAGKEITLFTPAVPDLPATEPAAMPDLPATEPAAESELPANDPAEPAPASATV